MTKRSLKTLLLFLGNIIWIVSLKAQASDSSVILNNKEIDYFISHQLDAQFLRKDTTFKGQELRGLNTIVLKQANIISNNESVLTIKNKEVTERQTALDNLSSKYIKQGKSLSFFKNTTAIFLCVTIILGMILVVK